METFAEKLQRYWRDRQQKGSALNEESDQFFREQAADRHTQRMQEHFRRMTEHARRMERDAGRKEQESRNAYREYQYQRFAEQNARWGARQPSETVSAQTIRGIFRTLAKKWHPDAGGTNEAMAALNEAQEELMKHLGGGL